MQRPGFSPGFFVVIFFYFEEIKSKEKAPGPFVPQGKLKPGRYRVQGNGLDRAPKAIAIFAYLHGRVGYNARHKRLTFLPQRNIAPGRLAYSHKI